MIGELVVAGPHVCRDYAGDERGDVFAENKVRDTDGTVWHRMGDTGYFDAQGRFWVAGRVHSTITRNRAEFHAQLVESAVLAEDARIRRVAAVGRPDAELGERLVVVIDPVMNPDGRERIISMVEQSAGYTPNLDHESMHRGRWPYGRGNHYLFDMNRDWMAGTQPETRGRWQAVQSFHPQLLVDAHEMSSLDTFLFYPQAEPLNPHLPPRHLFWQRAYAEGAARAFDAWGWSYYTREWADGWAPF